MWLRKSGISYQKNPDTLSLLEEDKEVVVKAEIPGMKKSSKT